MVASTADLAARIEYGREYAESVGREWDLDLCYALGFKREDGGGEVAEEIHELEQLGVEWVTVGLRGKSRAHYCEELERFGAEVIPSAQRPRRSEP